MKEIIRKIPKSLLVSQIIFFILGIFVLPKYFVYLFHVGIYSYYGIPEVYLNLESISYVTTVHYLLIYILSYLSVFFCTGFIFGGIFFSQTFDSIKVKENKMIHLIFILAVCILGLLGYLGILGINVFLIFAFTLSFIIILEHFFINNSANLLYYRFSFYVYTAIIILLLLIGFGGSIFLNFGKSFASKNLNTHKFQTTLIEGEKYLIFQFNENNFITKKIENNTIDSSFYIFNNSILDGKEITTQSLKTLKKSN